MDHAVADVLERCEAVIGYCFRDRELLAGALTHASGAKSRLLSNERLEFLGDAILGAVVCGELFHRFPDLLEGDLTKIKSVVVSRRTCARVSRTLSLGQFLLLGKGMTAAGPSIPSSLLADVFESLAGAIYLDGGMEAGRQFILTHMSGEIDRVVAGQYGGNYKSILQHVSQKEFGRTPTYQSLDEKGPDHAKAFLVAATIGERRFEAAWARNKKEAEQRAAQNALGELQADGVVDDHEFDFRSDTDRHRADQDDAEPPAP